MEKKLYESILESMYGVVAIDMEGIITYMTKECAAYLKVDRKTSLGRHIKDVFPNTQMIGNLNITETKKVFYHIYGKTGVSFHAPIFENGKKVGLVEYDFFQVIDGNTGVDEFYKQYMDFADEKIQYYKEEIKNLRNGNYTMDSLSGNSLAIQKVKEQISHAANSSSTVLISGETGTGKEVIANLIHYLSDRNKNDLVKINSSTIPEGLAESELFGYEGGAFTDAKREGKRGKFEIANKGTLFIDEINAMPMTLQPKLLRVLQEKEIERVGGEESIPIDTRIIAASNVDLNALTKKGEFRLDLYYRLNVMEIKVPSLRERREDIPDIIWDIVKKLNRQMGRKISNIEESVIEKLSSMDWPGNVRELQNTIERAMNYASGVTLEQDNFFFDKKEAIIPRELSLDGENPIEEAKKQVEREVIIEALRKTNNNKSQAAKLLKIARPLLYQKIDRLDITNIEIIESK